MNVQDSTTTSRSDRARHDAPFDPARLPDGTAFGARNQRCGLRLLVAVPNSVATLCIFVPQYRSVLDKMAYDNEGARQKGRGTLIQMDDTTIATLIVEIAQTLNPSGHLLLWINKFHLCQGVAPWLAGTSLSVVDLIVFHLRPPKFQRRLVEAVTTPSVLILDPAAGGFSTLEAVEAYTEPRAFLGTDLPHDPDPDPSRALATRWTGRRRPRQPLPWVLGSRARGRGMADLGLRRPPPLDHLPNLGAPGGGGACTDGGDVAASPWTLTTLACYHSGLISCLTTSNAGVAQG